MTKFMSLLLEVTYPDWVTNSFPVLRMIFMITIVLCALAVIFIILKMESNPEGGKNVISGSSDSFYSQNKSSTKEGRLKRLIVIFSVILIVITLLFFVSYMIYPA